MSLLDQYFTVCDDPDVSETTRYLFELFMSGLSRSKTDETKMVVCLESGGGLSLYSLAYSNSIYKDGTFYVYISDLHFYASITPPPDSGRELGCVYTNDSEDEIDAAQAIARLLPDINNRLSYIRWAAL